MAGEAKQELVARDQDVGPATRGENQEFLVVGIAATRQRICLVRSPIAQLDQVTVVRQQRRLFAGAESERRVAGDAFELGEAVGVAETRRPAGQDGRFQRMRARVVEVQHVDDDVGVEYEAHGGGAGRQRGSAVESADYIGPSGRPEFQFSFWAIFRLVMGRLFLAPMEGLADCVLRDVLTQAGGYDGAVTEFVRVSNLLLPHRTFRRISPELDNGSRTPAGTPVVVQLLGSDPACLAENAARLAELSPAGIDLNFGCPAPTVNRHGGGAMLLDDPAHLARIVSAVRRAVPEEIPVSAKMRLGVRDASKAVACAHALADGGVASLVVHARTRDEGYRPPAHWEWIARLREAVDVPVIANGEVWTPEDYARCRAVSGCVDVMIGRGAVADPFLARRIKAANAGERVVADGVSEWGELLSLLAAFWRLLSSRVLPNHAPSRLKLWLGSLRQTYAGAEALYRDVRPLRGVDETSCTLARHGVSVV